MAHCYLKSASPIAYQIPADNQPIIHHPEDQSAFLCPLTNTTRGLSLIELMVTICIVSVVATFAAVSFKPMWDKHQLNLAVKDMTGFIQLMRMKAILKRSTYQIKIVDNNLYYRRKNNKTWENWLKHTLDDATVYSMKGTSYFYSKGFASPKTITLGYKSNHQKIIININGRTRTSEIY